jgi:hypothetical protein
MPFSSTSKFSRSTYSTTASKFLTTSDSFEGEEVVSDPAKKHNIFDKFGDIDEDSPLYSYVQTFKQIYAVKEWVLGGTTGFFSLTTFIALCRWLSKKNRCSRSIQLIHRIITCREFTFAARFGLQREYDVELQEMGPPSLLGPFLSESRLDVVTHSPPSVEGTFLSAPSMDINIPRASTPNHDRQEIPDFPLNRPVYRTVSESVLSSPSFVAPITNLIRWSHRKVTGMRAHRGSINLGFVRHLNLDESAV